MAIFIKKQNGSLLNIISLQNIKIDPEDDKRLILYRINGQIVIENYDSASEASEAYDTYKEAMTSSEGSTEKELRERVAELSAQVVEQQEQISDLTTEVEQQDDIIDIATRISNNILNGE